MLSFLYFLYTFIIVHFLSCTHKNYDIHVNIFTDDKCIRIGVEVNLLIHFMRIRGEHPMRKNTSNDYVTQAPKEEEVTIDTSGRFPNKKNFPGDSVNEHESIENANAIIAEGEIGQQRENL